MIPHPYLAVVDAARKLFDSAWNITHQLAINGVDFPKPVANAVYALDCACSAMGPALDALDSASAADEDGGKLTEEQCYNVYCREIARQFEAGTEVADREKAVRMAIRAARNK